MLLKKIIAFLIAWHCIALAESPVENENLNYKSFEQMPILHDGRVKPFDTFSRAVLLQISGKSKFSKMSATEWMVGLVYQPGSRDTLKTFLVNNPEVAVSIGLEPDSKRHYSYKQIIDGGKFKLDAQARSAVSVEQNKRSSFQNEILRVQNSVQLYEDLMSSFSFLKPEAELAIKDSVVLNEVLLASGNLRYLDLYLASRLIDPRISKIRKTPKDSLNEQDHAYLKIGNDLYSWTQYYKKNTFYVVPFEYKGELNWLSPWNVLSEGVLAFPAAKQIMNSYEELYNSIQDKKYAEANKSLTQILEQSKNVSEKFVRYGAINAELTYNKLDTFTRAKMFLGFGILAALLSILFWRKKMNWLSTGLLIVAFLYTCMGIGLRMYITQRPPITNLFETFVFVAATVMLLGMIIRFVKDDFTGNFLGGIGGFALLMISGRYAAEGDTMRVLVAVLDTNFWLATHVVTISLGYGGVCAAGLIAHLYFAQQLFKPNDEKLLKGTYSSMLGLLGFGLAMSYIGTVLGGIWADQSWGRFWGWDPKENGALLIVLWCATLYHAKLVGWIHKLGMAVGCALGILVVMIAWFGINLLGVGLHSYGFTSGIAQGLLIYTIAQFIILGIVSPILLKRGHKF